MKESYQIDKRVGDECSNRFYWKIWK